MHSPSYLVRKLFFVVTLTGSLLLDISVASAKQCEKVIISGHGNYPPLSWNEKGILKGSAVDFALKVFKDLGVAAEADEGGPWKRVLYRTLKGEVDMLLSVRKSEQRETFLNYVEPPLTSAVQSVFVAKERPLEFSEWQDLIGKTGNVTLGTRFGQEFTAFSEKNLTLEYTETIEQAFKKLLNNRVQYVAGPKATYMLYLIKENAQMDVLAINPPLVTLREYFAFSKNSPCIGLMEEFQKRVSAYQNLGLFDELLENSFNEWYETQGFAEGEGL